MKRIVLITAALICLVGLFSVACVGIGYVGTGAIVTKSFDFKDFTGVEISNSLEYEINQSAGYNISVSTHENLVDRLEVSQSGETLIVKMKPGSYANLDTKVTITMPGLTRLAVSGASKGKASGFNSTDDLDLAVSGASRLEIDAASGKTSVEVTGASTAIGTLKAQDLKLNVSGASRYEINSSASTADINVSGASKLNGTLNFQDSRFTVSGASRCEINGSTNTSTIGLSGASHITAPEFQMQNIDIDLSGASGANIYASGELRVKATGASNLEYAGSPDVKLVDVSGASRVSPK